MRHEALANRIRDEDVPRGPRFAPILGGVHVCRTCGKGRFTAEAAAYGSLCENCVVRGWLQMGLGTKQPEQVRAFVD